MLVHLGLEVEPLVVVATEIGQDNIITGAALEACAKWLHH